MGKEISFVYSLSPELRDRLRIIAQKDKGKITNKEKQPIYFPDYNFAFTFAIQDLKSLWRWYRTGFEREIKQ